MRRPHAARTKKTVLVEATSNSTIGQYPNTMDENNTTKKDQNNSNNSNINNSSNSNNKATKRIHNDMFRRRSLLLDHHYHQTGPSSLSSTSTATTTTPPTITPRRYLPYWLIPTLVILVGMIASSMILAFGVYSARRETSLAFQDKCHLLHHQLGVAMEEYELIGQWVRQVADTVTVVSVTGDDGTGGTKIMAAREQFRQAYECVTEQVLQFGSIGVVQMVHNETQRSILQNDTRTFLRESINADMANQYVGFHNGSFLEPTDRRPNQNSPSTTPKYAVVHLEEPIVVDLPSTFDWIDVDLLALEETALAIQTLRKTEKPVLTKCRPCFGDDSVVLLHPGVRMSWEIDNSRMMETLSLVEIRLDYLLFRVFQRSGITKHAGMFLFDSTTVGQEEYLAGAYHEVIDSTVTTGNVVVHNANPNARVQDVYNAIVQNLTGFDANIWTISSQIDALKRAAVKEYTQPDGALVINGARFEPYQPPDTIVNLQTKHDRNQVMTIDLALRQWTIVIVGDDADYPLKLGYVVLSAVMLVAGCCCLALWIYTSEKRSHSLEEVRLRAELEKTDIIVHSARQAARNERELNDFIAHEVRNPLSAAISAATFVSARVNEAQPLTSPEAQDDVREDIRVIESSLQFINDLLRNMLDIHRASSRQLALNLEPMDVLHDALEPVASMLYSRTTRFKVEVDCPENLTIVADKIRLKQVILNLGRNAAKFVDKGFVRFRAALVEGKVVLYVEDSGPGIPIDKRDNLFKKFQESLDTLQQGTGIGLAVCHSIITLMGGSIELDENYDSQVEGQNCKGARFVVNLALEPISSHRLSFITSTLRNDSYTQSLSFMNSCVDAPVSDLGPSTLDLPGIIFNTNDKSSDDTYPNVQDPSSPKPLPHKLKILFVDDDMILRKLFVRSLSKALPEWSVEQCSNGETSIRLVDQGYYDIIFMDQYMASTDKQLLGTETVRTLRSKGGLSANDIEADFLAAGADAFMIKPFPGKPDEIRESLRKLLKNYDPPYQMSIVV